MFHFIKQACQSLRKSLHWDILEKIYPLYEDSVAQRNDIIKRLNQHAIQLEQQQQMLIKALADLNGTGLLELRLNNLHVPVKYRLAFYEMPDNSVCIDCGANEGLFTDVILSLNGKCHSFEPNPILSNLLRKKYRNNGDVVLNEVAVSNKNDTSYFRLPDKISDNYITYSDGGTIVPDAHNVLLERGELVNTYQVKVVRLVEYLEKVLETSQSIYILKLDIEGAEFDVIEDIIQSEIYKKIKYVFCETHARFFDDGEQRLQRIEKQLKDNAISNIYLDWH